MAIRHRTIALSDERREMLDLCATSLDIPASEFIRMAITFLILRCAYEDHTLALMLCRVAGVEWSELEDIAQMNLDAPGLAVDVDKVTEAEVVEREIHKRRLLEYSDKAERGIEPNRKWQLYHIGYMIAGATAKERIALARKLASKI